MSTPPWLKWLFYFWVILECIVADLASPWTFVEGSDVYLLENLPVRMLSKAGITVILMVITLANKSVAKSLQRMMLAALVLSLAGDLILAVPDLFVPGLAAFLLAHVMYIITFSKAAHKMKQLPIVKRLPLLPILIGAAASYIFYVLSNHLGDMAVPVAFYVITITVMAIFALNRLDRTSQRSWLMVFVGALVFMASDSLIAFNMFKKPIPHASALIMFTYALAQGMIVFGLLRHKKEGAGQN